MNVLVIGLGSMGRRRIRLIKHSFPEIKISGIDTNMQRRNQAEEEFHVCTYASINEACKDAIQNAAFVCTAPLTHKNIILDLIERKIHVFTELNLVTDGYDKFINESEGVVLFLSSTLLYRNDIQYIASTVKDKKVNYMYHVGQYLPDWHPWENYRDFFVGDKRTNGCREIFAIDLPWIIHAFGDVKEFHVNKDSLSKLDLDYNDNYMLSVVHENGTKGCICVDIVSRKAMRRLEVFSEELHIFWEGHPDSLMVYNISEKKLDKVEVYNDITRNKNYAENIIENAYLDEISIFFDLVNNKGNRTKYTFEDDLKVLELIDSIEKV